MSRSTQIFFFSLTSKVLTGWSKEWYHYLEWLNWLPSFYHSKILIRFKEVVMNFIFTTDTLCRQEFHLRRIRNPPPGTLWKSLDTPLLRKVLLRFYIKRKTSHNHERDHHVFVTTHFDDRGIVLSSWTGVRRPDP